MIKIDLITGFLGSGKTTFIKKYARWLVDRGQYVGILENDLGAVNVDMMLLQDIMGERCELEMVSGGCDRETHRRRFRTKLIAMGMSGYDRVVVEPSGIFDVDEFFDALREEPLDRWYEIGSVIAVVDAGLPRELPKTADYMLASEAASAGCILLSRSQKASGEEIRDTVAHLNRALEGIGCGRRLRLGKEIFCRNWEEFMEEDFERLASCGYVAEDYVKQSFDCEPAFDSLFFMHVHLEPEQLRRAAEGLLADTDCGKIFRIKGFLRDREGTCAENDAENGAGKESWIELNATRRETELRPVRAGQEIVIVIGEGLNKEKIETYLQGGEKG